MFRVITTIFTGLLVVVSANSAEINDIIFESKIINMKKAGVGPVLFPHGQHEKIYTCKGCHPKIFVEKKGANNVTMQQNIDGKYCGAAGCHNSAEAFPLYLCDACHTDSREPLDK